MTDDPAEIGRQLGIPPCPRCHEPLGARYGPERVCWPCTGIKPPRVRSPRPTRFQAFHERVWDRLERRTDSPVFLLAVGQIAAYCPACRAGTLAIRFLDADPPRMIVTSAELGPGRCSLGCTAEQITEALA